MRTRRGTGLDRPAADVGDEINPCIGVCHLNDGRLRRLNSRDGRQDTVGAFQPLKAGFM